jgi:magnesium chelatase family protein
MSAVQRYQQRLSGPLADRIDIHIDVARVPFQKLSSLEGGESSDAIRARVEAARNLQAQRFQQWEKRPVLINGDMGPAEVQHFCQLTEEGRTLMRTASQQMNLSARSYHRILKLSRTIADLDGVEQIETNHLAEALQYRPREAL